jgi:hypothetical protein
MTTASGQLPTAERIIVRRQVIPEAHLPYVLTMSEKLLDKRIMTMSVLLVIPSPSSETVIG